MTTTLFDGSSLLIQGSLFDGYVDDLKGESLRQLSPHRFSSTIRQALSAYDQEGALLAIEVEVAADASTDDQSRIVEHVAGLARLTIRRTDIIEQLNDNTLVVCLPGSGRIGMTRVADALRQRAWSTPLGAGSMSTTITIGAVHTTEGQLVDLEDLLLAALVNLDTARAAGGNRTNWSDWGQ